MSRVTQEGLPKSHQRKIKTKRSSESGKEVHSPDWTTTGTYSHPLSAICDLRNSTVDDGTSGPEPDSCTNQVTTKDLEEIILTVPEHHVRTILRRNPERY